MLSNRPGTNNTPSAYYGSTASNGDRTWVKAHWKYTNAGWVWIDGYWKPRSPQYN